MKASIVKDFANWFGHPFKWRPQPRSRKAEDQKGSDGRTGRDRGEHRCVNRDRGRDRARAGLPVTVCGCGAWTVRKADGKETDSCEAQRWRAEPRRPWTTGRMDRWSQGKLSLRHRWRQKDSL